MACAANKVAEISRSESIPLEELEEYIRQKQAEKETLLHEINEARAIIVQI